MKLAAIFASTFVAASLGMPLEMVQHEKRPGSGGSRAAMVKLGAAQPSTTVPVRIALAQRNLDRGMDLLLAVADPDSPTYGRHYTHQQVVDTFAPAQESVDAVRLWLVEAGIPEGGIALSRNRGYLDFETTVGTLASLLKTSYHIYEDSKTSAQYLGADSYSLPAGVAPHVDFVWPAVASSQVKAAKAAPGASTVARPLNQSEIRAIEADPLTDCSLYVTPACIGAMYRIPPAPKAVNPNNALGIFEIGGEMYKQSDIDLFYQTAAQNIPKGTGPKVDLINLASSPSPDDAVGEAALDFDMAIPIIYPQGTELYQVASGFRDILDALDSSYCEKGDSSECGTFTATNVISFSWGGSESDGSLAEKKRQCNEFMKLGLQGTTVVWSSGDFGVTGAMSCLGDNQQIFEADDPAGCPYALSIGATFLPKGRKPGDAEAVTETFAPGGGFSNIFPAPEYQKSAVDAYFAEHDPGFPTYNTSDRAIPRNGGPSGGIYNRVGRGYPDISAVGDFGVYAFNGGVGRDGGTSMSAPIIAGILTRINEERLAAGKRPVGFVNPALYKKPGLFRDVTEGRMRTDAQGACRGKSFSATPGWDPVTGLGTPDYPALSEYLNGLP
ncbi:hypothetical protein V2A60_005317 [Cordyceps javanica]|uniref:tripeptidyl-peptidase II n=1 Tax=Cordyceps javanica TaxID=43265 RepID=A0A545VE27_9HYPO|nr:protease S8 tripeptidyl peptidase I [Cordyceps javanica]TQW10436.1 protease S8 tripeptidyl peptidase I [Cordyceps javanica]